MFENKTQKNRVVRTKDSEIAFIGHGLESDGDILFKGKRDMQTNEVRWQAQSKARYGIDFVEADEPLSSQKDPATTLIEQQKETGMDTVMDGDILNTAGHKINLEFEPLQDPWVKAGFASKEEWKAAGKPEFKK